MAWSLPLNWFPVIILFWAASFVSITNTPSKFNYICKHKFTETRLFSFSNFVLPSATLFRKIFFKYIFWIQGLGLNLQQYIFRRKIELGLVSKAVSVLLCTSRDYSVMFCWRTYKFFTSEFCNGEKQWRTGYHT